MANTPGRNLLRLIGLALAGSVVFARFCVAASSAPGSSARRLTESALGLVLESRIDSIRVTPLPAASASSGIGYSAVWIPEGVSVARPGEPDVPLRRVVVGLPQQGTVSVFAQARDEKLLDGVRVAPVPAYAGDLPFWYEDSVYARDEFAPAPLAWIERIEYVRDIRCAWIIIAPVRFNPVRSQVRYAGVVEVSVRFSQPGQDVPADPRGELAADHLTRLLANGESARRWQTRTDTTPVRNFFDRSAVWLRIRIDSTGVYRIDHEDLKRAGVNPELLDPTTFRLFTLGEHTVNALPDSMIEVPLLCHGEQDTVFDRSDYLAFFGVASSRWNPGLRKFTRNLYTPYNYYWLTWGEGPGLRFPEEPAVPQGTAAVRQGWQRQRFEQDLLCPARGGLLWIWHELSKSASQDSASFDVELALPDPARVESVEIRLYSIDASPDIRGPKTNRVRFIINGALFDSVRFDPPRAGGPPEPKTFRYDFAARGLTLRGRDTLRIALVGDSLRTIFLDNIDIRYERRFDQTRPDVAFLLPSGEPRDVALGNPARQPLVLNVTSPWLPRRIAGPALIGESLRFCHPGTETAAYWIADLERLRDPLEVRRRTPGRIKADLTPTDYMIVAADPLADAAQILERYRRDNVPGILRARVRAVRMSDIYDEFSFGLEEPGALKAFFRLTRPLYGLLLGDATYDYRDTNQLKDVVPVPPYEIGEDLDPNVYNPYTYAIDSWFADFDGGGTSPDMIVARVTCRTPQELRRYVDKVIAYEQGQPGFWNRRILLLADDEIKADWLKPDELAANHIPSCEAIMNQVVGDRLEPVKVYLTEYPLENFEKPLAREALLRRLADGALIWVFFGHGAGFQLNHEKTLHIDNVPAVQTGRRQPVAFFGSCGVGRWEDSKFECIAEELVRKTDGAIATVGATKGTSPYGNESFCRQMLSVILDRDSTLGRAFYTGSLNGDKLYHLFGDPALRVQVPNPLESAIAVNPDTLRLGQLVRYQARLDTAGAGSFAACGFLYRQLRNYSSRWLNVSYYLPGAEFFQGMGRLAGDSAQGAAVVPNEILGARTVPGGGYFPVPGTARVSLVAWRDGACHSALRDGLSLDSIPTPTTDQTGPEIVPYADGKRIFEGDFLPTLFQLSAELSDSSGILTAPVGRFEQSLYFYVTSPGVQTARISVADRFQYDFGSFTVGRFTTACSLPAGPTVDTLVIVAADNYLNRSISRTAVQTRADQSVKIREPLVHPNPVDRDAWFTFYLNRGARVSARIYTMSGRLVRELPARDCGLGYNQIPWDGLDRDGRFLPNGIYLYRLEARTSERVQGATRESTNQLVEKLIVRR